MKAAFLICAVIFLAVASFGYLVWYQDHLESECYRKTASLVSENPDQLVELSAQEREELGISDGLIPTKRYYEMRRCVQAR